MADATLEESAPPSVAKRFALPAVALLLGAGAGAGGAMVAGGGDKAAEPASEEAAAEEAPAEEGAAAPAAPAAGGEVGAGGVNAASTAAAAASASPSGPVITNVGTFTVNLRGSGGGRVLRIEVQVESKGQHAPLVAAKAAPMRDSIITAVSDYTWSELEGTDGKVRLRDELLSRVNGITAPAVVERMYFTQFVVQ
jgi:flagellar FliL protein